MDESVSNKVFQVIADPFIVFKMRSNCRFCVVGVLGGGLSDKGSNCWVAIPISRFRYNLVIRLASQSEQRIRIAYPRRG